MNSFLQLQKCNFFKGIFHRFLILFLTLMIIPELFSQQTTLITQHMFTTMSYNPAFAGSSEGIAVTGLIRQQYIGFKDEKGNSVFPQTYIFSADAPLKVLHGGLGGSVMLEKIGFFNFTYVKIGYDYRTDLGPGTFSAGIQLDVNNTKIDPSQFTPEDQNDGIITGLQKSDLVADFTLGVFYKVPDKYYIGLSADQVAQSKQKKIYYQDKRTFYLNGGYNWVIPGHPAFEIQPSALFRTDLTQFQFDISALLMYNKKVWGGLGYRLQDAVSILAGMSIKGIKIGLSYDLSTSAMTKYNSGSLEVMLSYCFKVETEKFRKSYKNTRFL